MCPVDKNLYASIIATAVPIFFALRASMYWSASARVIVPAAFVVALVIGATVYATICDYPSLQALRVGAVNGVVMAALALFGFYIRKRSKRN